MKTISPPKNHGKPWNTAAILELLQRTARRYPIDKFDIEKANDIEISNIAVETGRTPVAIIAAWKQIHAYRRRGHLKYTNFDTSCQLALHQFNDIKIKEHKKVMRSTITTKAVPAEKVAKYPCLMRSIKSDAIVLFSSHAEGVVIHDVGSTLGNPVGTFSHAWDMANFKPYHGTVEISS